MTRPVVAASLAGALALAGCALGAGKGARGVSLVVTRDYGSTTIGAARVEKTPGSETVMRFLQRRFQVRTRYGGGFVQSIDGLAGGRQGGRPVDWFYYVNGVEAPKGAAATKLHAGDRVWWDRHDWGSVMRVPAVVGSFPEPFRSGLDGKRLPVQVGCASGAGSLCREVGRRLGAAGVNVAVGALGSPAGTHTLRVLVGPWRALRADPVARRLEKGPGSSGVFAVPGADGRSLAVLDAHASTVTTLHADAGLVAATRLRDDPPVWIVTGTDVAGTQAAVRSLTAQALGKRFALVVDRGRPVGVPVEGAA